MNAELEKYDLERHAKWVRGDDTITLQMKDGDGLEERLWRMLEGEGWRTRQMHREAKHRLAPGTLPPELYLQAGKDLVRRLEAAGVQRASCLCDLPRGWFPVIEAVADRLADLAQRIPEIGVRDAKEKFGELRMSFQCGQGATPKDRNELLDLGIWAESQSSGRCMATGNPGVMRDTGWIMTLDEESYALWQRDEDAVSALIYPRVQK